MVPSRRIRHRRWQGRHKVKDLITGLDNAEVPEFGRVAPWQIADQIDECDKRVDALQQRILACHRTMRPAATSPPSPASAPLPPQRLRPRSRSVCFQERPPISGMAGLVPRQIASQGPIGQHHQGGQHLYPPVLRVRWLLPVSSALPSARRRGETDWLKKMLGRGFARLAWFALGERMARIRLVRSAPGERSTEHDSIPARPDPTPKARPGEDPTCEGELSEVIAIRQSRMGKTRNGQAQGCAEWFGTYPRNSIMAHGHAYHLSRPNITVMAALERMFVLLHRLFCGRVALAMRQTVGDHRGFFGSWCLEHRRQPCFHQPGSRQGAAPDHRQ